MMGPGTVFIVVSLAIVASRVQAYNPADANVTRVGGLALKNSYTSELDKGTVIFLPNKVKEPSALVAVAGLFIWKDPVYFQIWRPVSQDVADQEMSDRLPGSTADWTLIHQRMMDPVVDNIDTYCRWVIEQDQTANGNCTYLLPGDMYAVFTPNGTEHWAFGFFETESSYKTWVHYLNDTPTVNQTYPMSVSFLKGSFTTNIYVKAGDTCILDGTLQEYITEAEDCDQHNWDVIWGWTAFGIIMAVFFVGILVTCCTKKSEPEWDTQAYLSHLELQ